MSELVRDDVRFREITRRAEPFPQVIVVPITEPLVRQRAERASSAGSSSAPASAASATPPTCPSTRWARLARSGGIADIADQIVANALSAQTRENNPAAVAFVRESIMRQDPESYARSCEALSKARAVDPRLIDAPALLVTGDADTVNPVSVAQALADKISGATLRTMDRCGHWATIERVQECNQALADFLRRVDR